MEEFFKPEDLADKWPHLEKLPPLTGPMTLKDGTVIWSVEEIDVESRTISERPIGNRRGSVLGEAMQVINGERQDVYGAPERSFQRIANYWTEYLGDQLGDSITPQDVAMMMVLFKIAREANQHKRDNIVDAAGYLGIYADMQERK